jgi:hypothetical protein
MLQGRLDIEFDTPAAATAAAAALPVGTTGYANEFPYNPGDPVFDAFQILRATIQADDVTVQWKVYVWCVQRHGNDTVNVYRDQCIENFSTLEGIDTAHYMYTYAKAKRVRNDQVQNSPVPLVELQGGRRHTRRHTRRFTRRSTRRSTRRI